MPILSGTNHQGMKDNQTCRKETRFRRDQLRTLVESDPWEPSVRYGDKILLMGSCFTEHIGNRLQEVKFQADLNPFGIVYNPVSMAEQLGLLMNPGQLDERDAVYHNGLWHSWLHHGSFSRPTFAELKEETGRRTTSSSRFLQEAGWLFLTFGTPEVFRLEPEGIAVSNCHKVPANRFRSSKPGPDELASAWIPLLERLFSYNPGLRIALTVSPVRYFKDGPSGNQLGKSILFLFIRKLMDRFPEILYFPAYELFMDDLRDYRFYDTDLVHPGPAGIEYVWEFFCRTCISDDARNLMTEVESVVRAVRHRPGSYPTGQRREFLNDLSARIGRLSALHPGLGFSGELEQIRLELSDKP